MKDNELNTKLRCIIKQMSRVKSLTLENREPSSCMVANVLGGSLASIPSKALDKEIISRSAYESDPLTLVESIGKADKEVKNRDLPANAIDVTALFNWCVAVI